MLTVGDKVKGLTIQVQQKSQEATYGLMHSIFRLITGFFLGHVIALIFQELFQFETLMLVFVTVVLMASIYRVMSKMTIFQILIFDLICVLIGGLLRMYIMIAPN